MLTLISVQIQKKSGSASQGAHQFVPNSSTGDLDLLLTLARPDELLAFVQWTHLVQVAPPTPELICI